MTLDVTPMERARSREQVAAAMRRFAAEGGQPMPRQHPAPSLRYTALARNPSTFGAGKPLAPVRPTRTRHVEIEAPPRTWLAVIDEVCVRHKLHRKDVLAGWKSVEAVQCRWEIWAELRARFGASYARIGRRTGGYHHTTVMHGLRCAARTGQSRAQEKANSHTLERTE